MFCNLILIQLSLGLAMIIIIIFGKIVMYFDSKFCNHTFNKNDVKCGKELSQIKKPLK